jgi:hypothetical protein
MNPIGFSCLAEGRPPEHRQVTVEGLVIAGWTGRDEAAVAEHIAELERLGVPRPATTPCYYRVGAALLTTAPAIEVLGRTSSGEAEAVIVSAEDGLWLGLGSDHTDRALERTGVALSKQVCPKPLAPVLWPLAEVEDHWDDLTLASVATQGGTSRLYQQGRLAAMRHPRDLIARLGGAGLAPGWVMFCGTLPVHGEIAHADILELSLEDPRLGRRIDHRYEVRALPVVG